MATVKLPDLHGGNDRPDLFFGVVAAVGTRWKELETYLAKRLVERGYQEVHTVRVSELLEGIKNLRKPYPSPDADAFQRISQLMDRGNELRERTRRKEALALVVASYIASVRARMDRAGVTKRAFLIHQLKNPDEVLWLRHIYGKAFHLMALFSPHADRRTFLRQDRGGMPFEDADALIKRDADEGKDYGQNVRGTFHLADLFMTYDTETLDKELERFLCLLFGQASQLPEGKRAFISPTKHEYGMYLAHAVALRSADLSRQVGASILDSNGDVFALGTNEVPAAGGGQYWEETGKPDYRDFVLGRDYNEFQRTEIVTEILSKLAPFMKTQLTDEQKDQLSRELESSTIADLTEFGRPVHAEMEAILSAARRGVTVRAARLYTTAFPCHNCAKHIVDAGIAEVTYIEPYPKSKALEMHSDSIMTTDFLIPAEHGGPGEHEKSKQNKVWFRPFVGVAPRRYSELFSYSSDEGERWRRKEKGTGGAVSFKEAGIRLRGPTLSLTQREEVAVRAVSEMEEELAK